jgi:hypothetical protein
MVDDPLRAAEQIAGEIDKVTMLAKAAHLDVVVYVLETAKREALKAADKAKPLAASSTESGPSSH